MAVGLGQAFRLIAVRFSGVLPTDERTRVSCSISSVTFGGGTVPLEVSPITTDDTSRKTRAAVSRTVSAVATTPAERNSRTTKEVRSLTGKFFGNPAMNSSTRGLADSGSVVPKNAFNRTRLSTSPPDASSVEAKTRGGEASDSNSRVEPDDLTCS